MRQLTHLSLFSGIGGLDLAAEMAGFVTVGQCEFADYPTKVLEKHWPDVPRWRDIRTLTKESFYERTGLRTVDIISGGFPCQPFSVAGQQRGTADDRYLWPEMLRVISELRPRWVFGENVPNIVNMALDTVLSDLETQGYTGQAYLIPACGIDAPHKRERCFILAYAKSPCNVGRLFGGAKDLATDGRQGSDNRGRTQSVIERQRGQDEPRIAGVVDGVRTGVYGVDPDPDLAELSRRGEIPIFRGGVQTQPRRISGVDPAGQNWVSEPAICRVVDGIPDRVDRVRALGNAVVPQQAYPFFAWIAEIMTEEDDK